MFGTNRGGIYAYVLGTMPADKAGINNLVKFSKTYMNDDGDVKFPLVNNVMSQLNMVDEILDILGQVFLYVGIGFALFSALLLMNFIATSISYKKREIGILRAVGARSSDVFKIFFSEALIIALINFTLSVATVIAATIGINGLMRSEGISLIVLAGFLAYIPETIVKTYEGRIINIHPSLLPKYGGKGMWGHHVHEAVLAAHETVSGITIHHVTENLDEGSIIFQAQCEVLPDDTPDSLAARIHQLEHAHYPRVVEQIAMK
jgi:hypothetical protein